MRATVVVWRQATRDALGYIMGSSFWPARASGVFLCVFGLVQGCAYVTAVPVKPGSNIAGIRIYDVKPILVVSGSSTEVKIVPNYNRAYALRFGAFLAKNNVDVTLQNGIPSQIKAEMDTTKFIDLLEKVVDKLPAGLGLSGEAPRAGVQDRFQVYDIVFDDQGNLVGLRPLIAHADLLKVKTTPPMSQGSNGAAVVPQPGATSLSAPLVVFQSPAAVPGAPPATVVPQPQ